MNIILVCGLHEWGHLAVMAVFRVRIKEVRLSGFGIRIVTEKSGAEPLIKSLVILLAGPAVNILLCVLLWEKTPDTSMLSLAAGVYNLLPFSQLDGGAVLENLIIGSKNENSLRIALRLLRMALFVLAAAMTYIYGYQMLPALAAVTGLCFAADER